MIYSNNPFEVLRSMTEPKGSTKRSSHFSPKKLFMGQIHNLPKIYATSYFMIHFIDICDMLTNMMGCNKQVNVTFKFTKIFHIGENWQFGVNLAQDFATLHLKMWSTFFFVLFCLRYFSMIGHNKFTKAISRQSSPKNFNLGQIDKMLFS